jgi:amidase
MADEELTWLDAVGQADLVRRREVTAEQLLDAALGRIDALNPALNAVIHRLDATAHRAAAAPGRGPLAGVPFLMKDGLARVAGAPRHEGMRALRDAGHVDDADSWFTHRLRAAGVLLCGKTNLPELATMPMCEPVAYGPTRNPWDPTRSTGGSSGGAAAAVASGMVAAAHGTDMGGSIRIPSSCCGLVGLKPSRARGTLGPELGEYWGPLTHQHVLTRTVRDTAAFLDVLAGPGPGDPYTAPPPQRPWSEEVGADPGRLRVGVLTRRADGLGAADPACDDAVEATLRLLERMGHSVVPDSAAALEDPALIGAFHPLLCAAIARDLERYGEVIGRPLGEADVEPNNWALAAMGGELTAAAYVAAIEQLQAYARTAATVWADVDIVVTPTLAIPPPPIGSGAGDDGLTTVMALAAFTIPFNATGEPAVSLPVHSAGGLPIGVQVVAPYGHEDRLIRVASALEEAVGWDRRHPPVAAPG